MLHGLLTPSLCTCFLSYSILCVGLLIVKKWVGVQGASGCILAVVMALTLLLALQVVRNGATAQVGGLHLN